MSIFYIWRHFAFVSIELISPLVGGIVLCLMKHLLLLLLYQRGLWDGTAGEGIFAVFGFLAIFFHDFLQLSVICFRLSGVSFDCRVYLSVFAIVYRMSLSMVVSSLLPNFGGCRSVLVVARFCRRSPTFPIVGN
jgi:hypothetical protein